MKKIHEILGLKTLKQRMVFWITLVTISSGIIGIILQSFIQYKNEQEKTINYMNDMVGVQKDYIDNWFEERSFNARSLANMDSFKTLDQEKMKTAMEDTVTNIKDLQTIHFANKDGYIEITTMPEAEGINVSDREYYSEALKGREHITDVLIGKVTKEPNIFFTSPVRNYNREIIGLVITSIKLDTINEIIERSHYRESGETYLVNREGYMLTESRFDDELINQNKVKSTDPMDIIIDSEIFKNALENKEQIGTYRDYRGEEVLGVYEWTNSDKWLIIGKMDKVELINELKNEIYGSIIIILCIVALIIFICIKLSNQIARMFDNLIKGTNTISKGNYSYRINLEKNHDLPDEIKVLCNGFNNMSITIEEKINLTEESEQKYKSLFEYNTDIIITMELEGKLIKVNNAAVQITEYPMEEIVGSSFKKFISNDKMEMTIQHFQKATKGKTQTFESVIISKNGRRIDLDIIVVPIVVNGNIIGIHGIAKDVTQNKEYQRKLEETARKLKESNEDLEQFAYVASHDLQEPLRMVTSYLQLLERRYKGQLDQSADEFIAFAVDGAKRMKILINDLLAYSRVNRKAREFTQVDSMEVLKKAKQNLEFCIEDKNASITYDQLPMIIGDITQLTYLFQNLINNGIKFNEQEKPMIHISAYEEKRHWKFLAKDNGIGINSEHKDKIFTIFQRLHSKNEYEGTGIGLAICKKIVERHGGHIWFESEKGKGTIFYFTILKGGNKNE